MNKLKSLLRVFSDKAVLCAVLALLFSVSSAPLFAQTADVRKAGVFYRENGATVETMYCNFGADKLDDSHDSVSFVTAPPPTGNKTPTNDPWVSSALIEYDQPYPSATASDNKYPNHCLALCMDVY